MTAIRLPRIQPPDHRSAPVIPVLLLVVAVALAASSLLAEPVGRSARPESRPAARVATVPGGPLTAASTGTSTSTSTTTTTTSAPPVPAAASVVVPTTAPPAPPAPPAVSTGCADAVAYIAAHAAPGYATTCAPGSALGHYGYTCANVPGRCDGVRIIHIACPAPFVYMNEAHNSWVVIGQGSGIDPYGQGTAAEQSYCDGFR